ncbi:hypothetical protein GCM10009416_35340 [Craurococcus roseus]|uniref:Uncharacterized protein n=1 Tax=Craurococcus roseus TaxID=77585 RepID=A0ABP3QUM1_9PROT
MPAEPCLAGAGQQAKRDQALMRRSPSHDLDNRGGTRWIPVQGADMVPPRASWNRRAAAGHAQRPVQNGLGTSWRRLGQVL